MAYQIRPHSTHKSVIQCACEQCISYDWHEFCNRSLSICPLLIQGQSPQSNLWLTALLKGTTMAAGSQSDNFQATSIQY